MKNFYDLVVDGLHERRNLVRSELHRRFAKVKPFRMEPVSPEEQLYNYNTMSREIEMDLRQSIGDEVVNDYIGKMEKLKRRK